MPTYWWSIYRLKIDTDEARTLNHSLPNGIWVGYTAANLEAYFLIFIMYVAEYEF